MPPPHLHPRSRLTSSLFATTLFASFFVVALPHVLPCPAPRRALADSDASCSGDGSTEQPPQRRRRRRRRSEEIEGDGEAKGAICEGRLLTVGERSGKKINKAENGVVEEESGGGDDLRDDGRALGMARSGKATRRECPVPKPAGFVGEILGFGKSSSRKSGGGDGVKPP